jgi:ABC-2 type transport system permease protein
MFAIYKKEMRSYFINPIGYVYLGIFLALSALVCCYTTLQSQSYNTSTYFTYMIFAFIILIPLLTMRSFAEERKMRTEQMLLTAPVSILGMVLGKYFAALTMFVGSLLLSCINFIPLYIIAHEETAAAIAGNQNPNVGPNTASIIGSLVGIILLGAAFIAIGIFISSLTENQLSSAICTIGVIVFMVIVGLVNGIGSEEEGNRLISNYAVRFVLDWISVLSRFSTFGYGLLEFSSLVYYVSLAAIFLFLTVRVYEKRRWE